ncbi:CopG family transcriptional regulator [Demequina sp.]|uniref:CopG family transcriptional regulator n=1 Tax=Demequina sp. TaxID=2050685 RepID=UPI003D0F5EBA
MKTAISVPDADFERFERVALRYGMTRSEFYQRAGRRLADELEEGTNALTEAANAALERAGASPVEDAFAVAAERALLENTEW